MIPLRQSNSISSLILYISARSIPAMSIKVILDLIPFSVDPPLLFCSTWMVNTQSDLPKLKKIVSKLLEHHAQSPVHKFNILAVWPLSQKDSQPHVHKYLTKLVNAFFPIQTLIIPLLQPLRCSNYAMLMFTLQRSTLGLPVVSLTAKQKCDTFHALTSILYYMNNNKHTLHLLSFCQQTPSF